jgi:VanZ family protein
VIYLSLGNAPQLGPDWFSFNGADKVKHALAYATLGVLWLNVLRFGTPSRLAQSRLSGLWLWFALFGLGAMLEVLQWSLFPQRYFEFADMLANGIGAGIGSLVFNRIFRS